MGAKMPQPEPKCPIGGGIAEEAGDVTVWNRHGFIEEIQPVLYCEKCDHVITFEDVDHKTLMRLPKAWGTK